MSTKQKAMVFEAPFTENSFNVSGDIIGGPTFLIGNGVVLNRSFVRGPFVQVGDAKDEMSALKSALIGQPVIINLSPLGQVEMGYEEDIIDAARSNEKETRLLATVIDLRPGIIVAGVFSDYEFDDEDDETTAVPLDGKIELLPIRNEWVESLTLVNDTDPKMIVNVKDFELFGIKKEEINQEFGTFIKIKKAKK